ncbi:thioredoxin family protein [Brevibacillus fluminis]|uniref:thioredoxin family protein n=1 Tax=Brevibacillus fluminis TaxID=511487 RepID=UPI001FECC1EE|nr:thioredoxin family protein [Brevibacillus fluminis]
MIKELTYDQLEEKRAFQQATFTLFVYTPLCGTCKATERMLHVVLQMLPGAALFKCNINVMPQLASQWQIQSVPCLMVFRQGELIKQEYAMKSVIDLMALLS